MQQPEPRTDVLVFLVRKGGEGGRFVAKENLVVGHALCGWTEVLPCEELMGTASTIGSSLIAFMEDPALDFLCDSD